MLRSQSRTGRYRAGDGCAGDPRPAGVSAATRARAIWSVGDELQLALRLEPVAEALIQAAGDQPRLNVAAGNGNVALAGTRRRAAVTAVASGLGPLPALASCCSTHAEGWA